VLPAADRTPHQAGPLQDPDVLRHRGQRHGEVPGDVGHACLALAEPVEDGAARRVGERGEGAVQFRFTVAEIASDRVAWRCTEGPPEWVGTEVRWLLTPAERGAKVRLEHRGWESADGELAQCSFVWAQVLERLGEYVGAGAARPYFRRTA